MPRIHVSGPKFNPESFVRHDPMGYIAPDRSFNIGANLPVPVNMFMPPVLPPYNMPPVQGLFYYIASVLLLWLLLLAISRYRFFDLDNE